jgi:hypothetical protein
LAEKNKLVVNILIRFASYSRWLGKYHFDKLIYTGAATMRLEQALLAV